MTLIELAQAATDYTTPVLTAVAVLWGALCTVVVAAWNNLSKRINDCESDRRNLWEAVGNLRNTKPPENE